MKISCTKTELAEFIATCAKNGAILCCDNCPLKQYCNGAYVDLVRDHFDIVEQEKKQ